MQTHKLNPKDLLVQLQVHGKVTERGPSGLLKLTSRLTLHGAHAQLTAYERGRDGWFFGVVCDLDCVPCKDLPAAISLFNLLNQV